MPAKPAIFVDRDGTLIEEVDHLSSVDALRVFPFTLEAIELFKTNGYYVIVITNQSGIGRKYFTEAAMQAIHLSLQDQLSNAVDAFYFCPHLPDEGCPCRKPGTGMIEAACNDHEIDLARSWMIGDKLIDVQTGKHAGTGSILVLTGYGMTSKVQLQDVNTQIADNLLDAAQMIVGKN
jgi:D-glycero-D-manno-heptose 1,7-bisphosphate phosphatase